MIEQRCKCRHYETNHKGGECIIGGCECIYYEHVDGNQMTTQSSGDNRGSEAQKTNAHVVEDRSPLSVEMAKRQTTCSHGSGNGHGYEATAMGSVRYCDDCDLRWPTGGNPRIAAADALIAAVRAEQSKQSDCCPCVYGQPCDPRCSCIQPLSSRGCEHCCKYGSEEQRKAAAERLVSVRAESAPVDRQQAIEQVKAAIVHGEECQAGWCSQCHCTWRYCECMRYAEESTAPPPPEGPCNCGIEHALAVLGSPVDPQEIAICGHCDQPNPIAYTTDDDVDLCVECYPALRDEITVRNLKPAEAELARLRAPGEHEKEQP